MTAYGVRLSDCSSDVCSSYLDGPVEHIDLEVQHFRRQACRTVEVHRQLAAGDSLLEVVDVLDGHGGIEVQRVAGRKGALETTVAADAALPADGLEQPSGRASGGASVGREVKIAGGAGN